MKKQIACYAREPAVREKDLIKWGYETAWFGRRKQRNKAKLKNVVKIRFRNYIKNKLKDTIINKIYRRILNVTKEKFA